ncbi:folylpolyglutamate synthase [Spiroplasma clarkii]|uniref:Mur ligase family protein n=1 Tax=Spiroplasma clarkii TaxID=2139 RepID=UPI000B57A0DF|nr:Mur ligase family protein [Spiroplasma clarkii]ARU92305.1 folylpolyglutamate synthase [Spiroplasma clarkii]
MLAKLNDPQNNFQVINVVGTNGKGSTATFIYQNLVEHQFKVGFFFSPAFLYQNERIQVNGTMISDADLVGLMEEYQELIKEYELTFFEIWTFLAIVYFNRCNIKIAIVEAGIGGVLDSTDCFANQIAVCLTSIGFDHEEILGKNIESIIANKIKIVKANSKIFTSTNNQKYDILLKKFTNNEIVYCPDYVPESSYQKYNKAIAQEVLKIFGIEFNQQTKPPLGRMTQLRSNPAFIIDGCHNLNGAQELINSLPNIHDFTILFASSTGKEQSEMVKLLKNSCKDFFVTTFTHPKAWDLSLVNEVNKVENWEEFLQENFKKIF